HPKRAEDSRRLRDDDRSDLQLARDGRRMEWPAATVREQSEVARIQATLQRYFSNDIRHGRGRHFDDPARGSLQVDTQGIGDPPAERSFRVRAIEPRF